MGTENRGGHRVGAGRKKGPDKIPFNTAISPEAKEKIKLIADKLHMSMANAVEKLIHDCPL